MALSTVTPRLDDGRVVDLTDLDLFVTGRAHEAWRVLRDHAPVHWNPDDGTGGGFWALTRHDDLRWAYSSPELFSSRRGTVLGGSFRSDDDTASGQMIICSDPPRHRLLRQQVHHGFERQMITRIRERVRGDLDSVLDRVLADGGCDLAVDVAPVPPTSVLRVMFGIDQDSAERLLAVSREIIGYRDDETTGPADERTRLVTAHARMFEMLFTLIEQRRSTPGDDLPSYLLASRINGRPMSRETILYNCLNVIVGGNETTPYTLCAGAEALAVHPGQEERLHSAPEELLPTALEEILRWTSTNAYVGRTLTRDTERHGIVMREGDRVTLWNASANRDERVFADPGRFDLGRSPNPQLAFGFGAHRCIGHYVAREELRAFFEKLATRRIRLRPSGPIRRLRSNFMQGTVHMPVTVVDAEADT